MERYNYQLKKLVLCLGNEIHADDGVALRVAKELRGKLPPGVDLEEAPVAGLYVLDYLVGYEFAVVVDAYLPENPQPGRVRVFELVPDGSPPVGASPHFFSFLDVLNWGVRRGIPVPKRLVVVGVEVADPFRFGEELDPRVEAAVPEAVKAVLEVLKDA